MSGWIERWWYRRDDGLLGRLLGLPLWLLSLVFGMLVRRRVRHWARPGRARRVEARVISVGNLTVGGAGKTPVTIHLAQRLLAAGEVPCILSRGYGREQAARALVVSDGERICASPREAGDEPILIARSCPGAKVLVGPNRAALAQEAIDRFGARTLLLDDGLQHLRLARDLDVVVLDASNPFGNGCLLPRGPLREPKESLRRAGLLWMSKVDQATGGEIGMLEQELRRYSEAPIVKAAYRVVDVLDDAGASLGPRALAGKRVLLMAGVARPDSFRRTLESMGAAIVEERLFADHHRFLPREVEQAKLRARALDVDAIALTEKDAVRLPDSANRGAFAVVRIEVEIRAGAEAVDGLGVRPQRQNR